MFRYQKRGLYITVLIGLFVLIIPQTGWTYTQQEIESERVLGQHLASQIATKYGVVDNEKWTSYVNLVGGVQVYYNGRKDIKFYFSILDTEEKNAWACPGGYIFITKGLLLSLNNEAELAAVLAHEIAHVNMRHVYNKVKAVRGEEMPDMIASMLASKHVMITMAFNEMVEKGLEVMFKKGLEQDEEKEADIATLFYLKNSGYNQKVYYALLKKQKYDSKTHQTTKDRLSTVKKYTDKKQPNRQLLAKRFKTYVEK